MADEILKTQGDTDWFVNDRFGMFIHWGLYSMAARHEWFKQIEEISNEDYEIYFKNFDPDLYEPEIWAKAAADAGMKYFVITTKHHEGFCLWDSKLTDYKATNTPAGRDLLTPMVEAFRAQDMRTGFYHSLIDWHHPDFPIDDLHSQRNHPDRAKMNETRDVSKYAEYLHGQVRELLTQFGKVDVLWFDFSYRGGTTGFADNWIGKGHEDWQSDKLIKMIRELAPNIIMDDRLDIDYGWDIKTPEQFMPNDWVRVNGQRVVWEGCHTFSGSWGYHRDEQTWKSSEQLLGMLIDSVSKGGNLLLNVGPTGRGELDYRALDRLKNMGEWMKRHNRSIYGCTQAPADMIAPKDCRYTYNAKTNRLYLHFLAWPVFQAFLPGLAGRVEYAQLLNDGSQIKMPNVPPHQISMSGHTDDTLVLELPIIKPNVAIPVIELFLK